MERNKPVHAPEAADGTTVLAVAAAVAPVVAGRHRGRRGRSPSRASRALPALTVLLVAVAALLALPLQAQAQAQTTFVSNLEQTTHASFIANLSTTDVSQQFHVGSTEVTLSTVKVKFHTVPGSMATVTAVIATGRGSSDSILATLTNPATWSTTSTFTAPAGTTLAAGTNYHLIIEGTDGLLATTASDGEDSGGATGWLIGNTRQQRTMVADSGLGGTWTGAANVLQISLEGPGLPPAPGVNSIAFNSAGNDGAFKTGDAVTATVTFSEAVDVDTTGGTPQLEIDVGGTAKTLSYASGTGTTALVFSGYTVAANDEDTDGISIEANKLDANSGTIKATSGDNPDAVLTHAAVAASAMHKVDGVKPTLVTTGDDAPKTSTDGTQVILTFSEAIGTVDHTKITLMSGTNTLSTTADSMSGSRVEITLTTALTSSDTMVTVELDAEAVTDVPGNGNAALAATTVSVDDTTAPTLTEAGTTSTTEILLSFDEALDSTSIPSTSQFAVTVGGASRTVSSIALSGTMGIALTLSTPMLSRDTITVSYTKPNTNPLQDAANNEVESFTGQPVLNEIRDTFVSNLGQTTNPNITGNLSNIDLAQRFDTGSTASFDFTEVEVLFATAPSNTATVTAIIADGLGSTDNIVATLTNPSTWSTNPRFGIPSGTTLSKDTTYYLIIEATDGVLKSTSSNDEDSGGAAGWTIGNTASSRAMVSNSGLGGTWAGVTAVSLQMAIRGLHHGNPGTPELVVTAKDQTLVLDVTVPDHGSSDLTGIEYRYKETTSGAYTGWTSVTGTISNSGGTFEIGGLNNGTGYTAQVQTVNDIGTSDPSTEESATPDAPPAVTSIAITSDAGSDNTYAIGDDIEITVTFDKTLIVAGTHTNRTPAYIAFLTDYAADTPSVDPPEANCVIGTDTKTLLCTDIVQAGWYDNDGIAVGANFLADAFTQSYVAGPLNQRANLAHAAIAADSNHKIDGVRPTLTGARASADKTKITLTFSEAIGAVDRTKITFQSGTTTLTTTADSISGSEVEITLTTALTATDTNVTVALAADAVTDAVGNGNAVLAASPIVDETAPTLSMTSTPSNTEVLLTYNEPLDPDSIPGTSAFTVKVGGTSRTISTAAASGASGIVLTLSTAFRPGDTLTVSYTVPTLNPIQDIAGNDAAALTNEAVSNTLPATAPDAPGSLAANAEKISVTPLRLAADRMELTWNTPWANGDAITKFRVRHVEGSTAGGTWTDIDGSGAGTREHTVGGLKPDTEYTFEVQAVNGIGNGAAATVTQRTPAPAWSFTLRDSANNNVTELTEGGDSATATVSIINSVRFSADQTVMLEWGGVDLASRRPIQGANEATTITIPANGSSGSLEISAPQKTVDIYEGSATYPFTATHGGNQIGNSIDLTRLDDEAVPVASITQAPTTVNEGERTSRSR